MSKKIYALVYQDNIHEDIVGVFSTEEKARGFHKDTFDKRALEVSERWKDAETPEEGKLPDGFRWQRSLMNGPDSRSIVREIGLRRIVFREISLEDSLELFGVSKLQEGDGCYDIQEWILDPDFGGKLTF